MTSLKRFLQGENVDTEVSPSIYRSWQRSLAYQIDHKRISLDPIFSAPVIQERRELEETLIRAGKPVLPYLFSLIGSKDFTVILGGKDGFILEASGDAPFMNKAQKVHLAPGADWNETVRGTNAIGTALSENAPMTVWGWEHFIQENQFLACWAAPIRDQAGKPIGVLDISGEVKNARPNMLEITMIGASLIEKNLMLLDLKKQLQFYQEGFNVASELIQQGFISIDRQGIIKDINSIGASLLGRKRDDIIGRQASELFSSPKGWSVQNQHLNLRSKEISGKDIDSSLTSISDTAGEFLGAIGTIQPTKLTLSTSQSLWIGRSPQSQKLQERARKAALTNSAVLIHGESGTGKEIIARTIHQMSNRINGPFVALNCAALPSSLVESELFGYADGAFTGARRGGQAGKFELANEGTIFLDEIGDMPLHVQVSLLRVLQEKEVIRVGGTKAQKIDVRIIAATNKDLVALIKEEKFRLDLYYRLKVVTLETPPLRERPEDIWDFVPHFVHKICESLGKSPLGVSDKVYTRFLSHSWPGNVRELENCIESMVALADGPVLTEDDLPEELQKAETPIEAETLLDQQTKQAIQLALAQSKGRIAPAARLLGIGRNTLYRKIKELDIEMH